MADVLSQGDYTGETLRDLASFLDREVEAVSSVDAFTRAIGEWLGGRRELTECAEEDSNLHPVIPDQALKSVGA
jgi:hypothetical protein